MVWSNNTISSLEEPFKLNITFTTITLNIVPLRAIVLKARCVFCEAYHSRDHFLAAVECCETEVLAGVSNTKYPTILRLRKLEASDHYKGQ